MAFPKGCGENTRGTLAEERYVDHARDPGKDNVIIIVRKHNAYHK